ncbi:hypothetical protein L202_04122 [Cryptococcus amylolentus CBS 6039]|uniref:DNA replication factor Cdt1 C-terminal domain-containing protein n=1 Tax=Cryptococcus amylolentus CBS 6039 TaxID=1295533 RepID=A0A1E3HSQ0_9TREE|nr:hypothetical protein L202_04122 [Cryptococcus amylolentus CBS 6039]ODN78491.1 hypothetical protein L202_04122 [Cryptococcus amylolentus CBS 6039]
MSNITPRKRKADSRGEKAAESSVPTPRSGRTSKRVATGASRGSSSNPVPFPTPPATRHRNANLPGQSAVPLGLPSHPDAAPLPPHLSSLLNLHRAFNLALSLHIATHHPVLPPHSSTATSVKLPNLTNYLAIKETVERTCGKRFGPEELGRLAWVWGWDGEEIMDEKAVSEKNKKAMLDEDNPFVVPASPALGAGEVSGSTYLITSTRALEQSTGRRIYTHGLGIELELRQGETRQLLANSDGGFRNQGQGGGTAAIGRWTATGEVREHNFRAKLEKWVKLHGGYEPSEASVLPTPSTSEDSTRSSIPPIPILPLPSLPTATLPAANLMAAFTSPSSGPTSTLTPKKNHLPPSFDSPKTAGLSDPFEIGDKEGDVKGKIVRPGSVEERRKAMMARIKAKSTGKGSLSTLGSSVGGFGRPGTTSSQQEGLKRRSILSRLEGVAESVWMMFSGPALGSSSLPTPPRGRRKAIPMAEAAEVIVKSSKTPISTAEAQTSLQMLTELCPFFLHIKTIGRQDWIEMPSAVTVPAPLSPTAATGFSASPSASTLPARQLPASPSTPGRLKGELAGPASPGKIRRQGGLREVREIIRRELDN